MVFCHCLPIQTLSHVWESAAWAGDRGLLAKTSPSDAARWLAQTALQLEGGQITRCALLSGPPARYCQEPVTRGRGGPERRPRSQQAGLLGVEVHAAVLVAAAK